MGFPMSSETPTRYKAIKEQLGLHATGNAAVIQNNDGFHSLLFFQSCPLDLHTDCFYANRREAIESRAEMLREASAETLQELIADVWNGQEGKVCALINWELFSSLQQAQVSTDIITYGFKSIIIILVIHITKYPNHDYNKY